MRDVETILQELTLEEKASLCSGADLWHLKAVGGLGQITLTDGPHGLRKQPDSAVAGITGEPATCFPTAVTLASSWDPDLVREVGAAIGAEAVAQGVAVVLGPGANIKRHPLCGRNFEYLSEDPHVTGVLAAALIDGIQSTGVGASLKHFAANNQESHRNVVDVIADERTLREIYLAGFEHAVQQAAPATVMCSYNKINGTYSSDNRWLLTEVLRDEWGFQGAVVSDWGAVNDRVAGVRAGLDIEMPGSGGMNDAAIVAAVRDGRLRVEELDAVARRVLTLICTTSEALAGAAPADTDRHHALAARAAAESSVLLTNDGVLPLDPERSVAVIGAFATEPRYQGAGSSQVTPTRLDGALDAIRDVATGRVTFAAGYESGTDALRPDLVEEAVAAARGADVAVVVAGLPALYESEGYDRAHLRLPVQQDRLIRAVAAANRNTVVVLCGGGAVSVPWVDAVRAVVVAHLGGQAGGTAIADVLFGRVDPSGHLAETWPLDQADHGSDAWFPGMPRQVEYREGLFIGYRWFDTTGTPVRFPFGHGLGYTTFELSDLEVGGDSDADSPAFGLTAHVTVTNTGDRPGAEVVQVYVRTPGSRVERPDKELRGFVKVRLDPGASQRVAVALDRRAFAHYDVASAAWQVEGGEREVLAGVSSRDIRATATVTVGSSFVPQDEPPVVPSHASLTDTAAFERRLGHPVPEPVPVRPFHRNSTLGEVRGTPTGALLARVAATVARRQLGDDLDDGVARMIDRGLAEMPLRSLALLSGGKISYRALDAMIATMNRWPMRGRSRKDST